MNRLKSCAMVIAMAVCSPPAWAATVGPKDVDLVFVIDRSASMRSEFRTLSANLQSVADTFRASTDVVRSLGIGLITYLDTPELVQDVTLDVSAVVSALDEVNFGAPRENGLIAVDSAIPGGESFIGVNWRPVTVRSVVLLTDEDADDEGTYPGSYAGLADFVREAGYLNNIIAPRGSVANQYSDAAVPDGALFDLRQFVSSPEEFFPAFVAAKIDEISVTDPVDEDEVSPIPLPAGMPLLLGSFGMLAFVRERYSRMRSLS